MRIGAIEAGGTKFVCAIGDEFGNFDQIISIKTTTPDQTMQEVVEFFQQFEIDGMAVASFGPIDLNETSETYGCIKNTPKKAWINFDIIGTLKEKFDVPIRFNTDVNCAALGELKLGAAKGLDSCVYMTVGTGIGVGAIVKNELVSGMLHPEMGHIFVKRHVDDEFVGNCIYHHDCLEGLASGKAIDIRWETNAVNLNKSHSAWELEAYYLAQGIVNFILILSPKKIIIGGGVSNQLHLFPLIHKYVNEFLNGYIDTNELSDISNYIVPPMLGNDAGIKGTLLLFSN